MECLEIVPGIWQMPQWASQPASSHIRLHLVNAQSNSSIPSLEPAAECNTSLLLKAKPVEPVTFYPCRMPPPDHHIDFGFVQRHGDRTCLSRGIDKESVILHVIWWRKSSCLPMLLRVSFFLSSVTKLWDMIIRLWMCKGWTHRVKVLQSKSRGNMAKTFHYYLQVTVKPQSKSYIINEIYRENLSGWCHTCHRKSSLCS